MWRWPMRRDLREIGEILGDILSDDQRANSVIRGLRSLLRKSGVKFEPIDINYLVHRVIGLIRSDAVIKHVSVETHPHHLTP